MMLCGRSLWHGFIRPGRWLDCPAVPPLGGTDTRSLPAQIAMDLLLVSVTADIGDDEASEEVLLRGLWANLIDCWIAGNSFFAWFHVIRQVLSVHLNSWICLIFSHVGPFCVICALLRSGTYQMMPAAYAAYPQRRWLFLLGLAPFCVAVGAVWFAFGRNANLAGGFAGRRVLVFSCVFCLFFGGFRFLWIAACTWPQCYVLYLALTASTAVRTEPRATSAVPGKKMSYSCSILSNSWIVAVLWLQNCITAPSMDRGQPSSMCDSSNASPLFSMMDPDMGTSIVALKLTISCLLFQVSTAKRPFSASRSTAGNLGSCSWGKTS